MSLSYISSHDSLQLKLLTLAPCFEYYNFVNYFTAPPRASTASQPLKAPKTQASSLYPIPYSFSIIVAFLFKFYFILFFIYLNRSLLRSFQSQNISKSTNKQKKMRVCSMKKKGSWMAENITKDDGDGE